MSYSLCTPHTLFKFEEIDMRDTLFVKYLTYMAYIENASEVFDMLDTEKV